MDNIEIWRPIKGYEGLYEVSNFGRVRSLDRIVENKNKGSWRCRLTRGRVLCPGDNGSKIGYLFVNLSKNGKTREFYIHRLVAEAFVDNPNNHTIINHKDENGKNNRADNLEWCTQKYNCNYGSHLDKVRSFLLSDKNPNRGKPRPESFKEKVRKPVLQFDRQGNLIKEWDSARTAGNTLGIYPQSITSVCRRRFPSYKNFIWRYKNDCRDPGTAKEA